MDLEFGRQHAYRRKRLPGPEFAAQKSLLGCVDHLVENRFARTQLEIQQCHINTVTVVTVTVNEKLRGDNRRDHVSRQEMRDSAENSLPAHGYTVITAAPRCDRQPCRK